MNDKDIEAFMDKLDDEHIGSSSADQYSKSEREFADLFERLGDTSDDELTENSKYALFQHRLTAYQAGLEDAKAEANPQATPKTASFPQNRTSFLTLLAAACLAIGAITILKWDNNTSSPDAELRNEVAGLKNMLVLSLLSHESPIQRMEGVSQARLLENPSEQITNQLFWILNNDSNVNVRLAAISGLGSIDPTISHRLLDSLTDQSSVLVQLEIVHTVLNFGKEADQDRLRRLISESDLAPDRANRFKHVINTGI